ncbi:5577_t:CDS:1, partial [Gigaspora margarita]
NQQEKWILNITRTTKKRPTMIQTTAPMMVSTVAPALNPNYSKGENKV